MLQQRIDKLCAQIEKLLDRLLVAHTVYATLRPMMVDNKLLDRIFREKKGAGFDTIRHTFLLGVNGKRLINLFGGN